MSNLKSNVHPMSENEVVMVKYHYQHGRLTCSVGQADSSASLELSFGAISDSRSQITLSLSNNIDIDINDASGFMGPAEHTFQVNYPTGEFDEATLRIENSWTNNDILNQLNAHASAKDDMYEVSAENVNSFNGEQNTVSFDAQAQIEANAYEFGSALNYNDDAVYGELLIKLKYLT